MFRASFIALTILSGCSGQGSTSQAEDAVKAVMRDPDSAKFRNLEVNDDGSVCGEVNGRNAYGGMTGFSPFAYVEGVPIFYGEGGEFADSTRIINACSSRFDKMIFAIRATQEG
jgi:hypothetical protein